MTRHSPLRRSAFRRTRRPWPRKRREPVKLTKDGRLILSGAAYTAHKRRIWEAQGRACNECRRALAFEDAELHHIGGRGMAGGKRDDRESEVLCVPCHREFTPKLHFGRAHDARRIPGKCR